MQNKFYYLTLLLKTSLVFAAIGLLASCKKLEDQSNFSSFDRPGNDRSFRLQMGSNREFLILWDTNDLPRIEYIDSKSTVTLPVPLAGQTTDLDIRSFDFGLIFSVNAGSAVCQSFAARVDQQNNAKCLTFEEACTHQGWGSIESGSVCRCASQTYDQNHFLQTSINAARSQLNIAYICANDKKTPDQPLNQSSTKPKPNSTEEARKKTFGDLCIATNAGLDQTGEVCLCKTPIRLDEFKGKEINASIFDTCETP